MTPKGQVWQSDATAYPVPLRNLIRATIRDAIRYTGVSCWHWCGPTAATTGRNANVAVFSFYYAIQDGGDGKLYRGVVRRFLLSDWRPLENRHREIMTTCVHDPLCVNPDHSDVVNPAYNLRSEE